MTRRSIEFNKARADAFADAFENYDPKIGDRDALIPPVMAVKLAAWRRDAADHDLAEAVQAACEQQVSWREIGEGIGTSGEATRQRYSPRPSRMVILGRTRGEKAWAGDGVAGLLLITFDNSILYAALPTLPEQLGASGSQSLWIMNAYPSVGDRFGHQRIFLISLIIFGLALL